MKSLLPPQTCSQSQTQPRVLQECRQTRTHRAASGPILHHPYTHSQQAERMPQAGATYAQIHTQTHLLSLCITNTNELIDVQQRQRSRQSFPQSEQGGRENQLCVCVFVSRVLFYFLSASKPLGFHRLRLSDGAKLAKLRSAGPDETPVVRLGAV